MNGEARQEIAGNSGNFRTAPEHSVSLNWNTSTSSGVAGYNIYRATA
jgi:hypothetical protein